jgi:hypothetical protein
VRVIFIKNFDRLVEAALHTEGVRPSVLTTPAAIREGMPGVRTPYRILKVHGDFFAWITRTAEPGKRS